MKIKLLRSKSVQVTFGFLIGIALNLAIMWGIRVISDPQGTLFFAQVRPTVFYAFVFFGATQLIWQLPLILLLRKNYNNLALGLLLAAVVSALPAALGRFEVR